MDDEMIHVEHWDADEDGNARDLTDAGKLRLLASYFDMQDAITGSSEPEIQQDLLRMADRMEDLKIVRDWWHNELDGVDHTVTGENLFREAIDRIVAEGAVK
jgi:hypothetical protein